MGKWTKYNDFILENKDKSKSEIARMVYTQFGLDPSCFHAIRHHIKRLLNKYDNSAIEEYCEAMGIPAHRVDAYWHKGEFNGNDFSVRVSSEGSDDGISTEDIEDVVKSVLSDYKPVAVQTNDIAFESALKVVLSDMHVGLEPNPEGNSVFQYKYDEEIFNNNLDSVYDSIMQEYKEHGTFELFILDDLGDGLDGWDGFTTRGGHKLDQNMNNKEAFDVYVRGKYNLIRRIIESGVASKYVVRSVSNCNHSGDFGWIANKTVEYMVSCSGVENVQFVLLERFMEHFTWGDHCFILTHGKDKKHMNRGLPLVLNDRTINFIHDYMDHYDIRSKYVHVEKGDLHQVGYQRTRKFDYRNYMTFAPPSAWVQHNFGDTYSGYSVQIVPKYSNRIKHSDIFFEMEKVK